MIYAYMVLSPGHILQEPLARAWAILQGPGLYLLQRSLMRQFLPLVLVHDPCLVTITVLHWMEVTTGFDLHMEIYPRRHIEILVFANKQLSPCTSPHWRELVSCNTFEVLQN